MSVPAFLPIIEGFWIRNFKVLKQIAFGSSFQQSVVLDAESDLSPYELTSLTTFIGESGCGKSTILDVFAFLADCLHSGLDEALERRGGFEAVYSRDGDGPLSLGLTYRACAEPKPLTYAININRKPGSQHAFVETEAIVYRGSHHGAAAQPILFFQNGEKTVRHVMPWHHAGQAELDRIKRTDPRHLALSLLAEYEDLPDVPQLKRHLDRFHKACYSPDNAVGLSPPRFKPSKGGRLATEFKRMEEKHHFELPDILKVIARRMPHTEDVFYEKTEAGRTILYFKVPGIKEPFCAAQMSEGALRLFSHLLLFEDPVPTPLIGIEEPNAYMDDVQIQTFASFIRDYVREMGGTQFFMTTHQSSLADFMDPTEVWMLLRDADGSVKACRALDELTFRGVDLSTVGPYWYTDHFYRKNP